jgi:alkylation response protein AidB-like acyl-CoA dehydrogenase
MVFQPPIAEIAFTLDKIASFDAALASGVLGDLSTETVHDILAEAGRFAADELAPINRAGDRVGARRENGSVFTAPGWREAYRRFRDAGWGGIAAPEAWGGQGLPVTIGMAVQELWNAGAAAFAVGPMLTSGAIDAIEAHASSALKQRYLPRLASGEWMATMNLTEPQAGSDLGAIRTRAERVGDGTYRLSGQKIFITFGEHDFTDNIIHLVLARLADAPEGTRGISLFLVPKHLVNDDGSLGARNDVVCAGIEKKLGLHGSPTCTMIYGGNGEGAVGWLVGEENRGLACMFTMMNIARLSVGIQGVGVADRAFDEALAYARSRRQGRAPGASGRAMSPIVEHPDVQATLLRMKALTAAARAICYATAYATDMSRRGPESERARFADRASLLTPIAKAFATDIGIEVASLGIQVHGGMGFIEETGAAQHLRDVRVFAIYEGTNGIQAIDLVTRKLKLADGDAVRRLLDEFADIAAGAEASNRTGFGETGRRLAAALIDLRRATDFLVSALDRGEHAEALAGASAYLRLFALTAGGVLLARGALAAADDERWVALARFFAETMAGETAALASTVTGGAAALRQAAGALLTDAG